MRSVGNPIETLIEVIDSRYRVLFAGKLGDRIVLSSDTGCRSRSGSLVLYSGGETQHFDH